MHQNFRFQLQVGMKKQFVTYFLCRIIGPQWRWCQICQHCRKLWWSSYIETAAEMLPKGGSSKVAWPLRPCNVCLFFAWRRATMKIEGFIMVVCCLSECQTTWYSSFPIAPSLTMSAWSAQSGVRAAKYHRQNAYLTAMFGHYIGGYFKN